MRPSGRWMTGTRFGAMVGVALLACSIIAVPARGEGELPDRWEPLWMRTVAREISAVATDANGDVYVTGWVDSRDGYWRSMVVAGYARDGERLWRRVWPQHGGRYPYSVGSDVAVAPDGGTVYVGGAEFNDSTEVARARLWAFTTDGTLRWGAVAWPGSSVEIRAVAADRDGAVVGATTSGECGWPHDGRLAAFDGQGNRLWTDPFEAPGIDGTSDAVADVAIGSDGRVYAVGSIDRTPVSCDDVFAGIWSDEDIVVQQLTRDGIVGWRSVLDDADVKDREGATAVTVGEGGIVVSGRIDATRRLIGRAWLASFSDGGDVDWSRIWGPGRPASSIATAVSAAPWGPLFVSGSVRRASFLRSYTVDGALLPGRLPARVSAAGVSTGLHRTLYVIGGSRLWRLRA